MVFRNIFPGSVRDHGVVTFKDEKTPGPGAPRQRRRLEDRGLPASRAQHRDPAGRLYHVAWFTDGSARKGLFYARADNGDTPFAAPRALSTPRRQPARPYLLANGNALHLVWKEFDGTKSMVRWQVSHDSGRTWSDPRTVADTEDASDHPLLVANAGRAYLSWLTKADGYRLIPLEDQP